MAGVFVSAAREWGIRTLSSLLPATRQREEEDLEELARLERTMRRIHATLEDADSRCCYRSHVQDRAAAAKLRLRELRGVVYDAEDVVGEYEYEVTRCKMEAPELERARNSGRHKRKRSGKEEPLGPARKQRWSVTKQNLSTTGWQLVTHDTGDHQVCAELL